MEKHRVAIVGSGNWSVLLVQHTKRDGDKRLTGRDDDDDDDDDAKRGSAVATIIGENVARHPHLFVDAEVRMYVYEELIDGRPLTEIINQEHENVKSVLPSSSSFFFPLCCLSGGSRG